MFITVELTPRLTVSAARIGFYKTIGKACVEEIRNMEMTQRLHTCVRSS